MAKSKYYVGFGDVDIPEGATEAEVDEAIKAFRAEKPNRAYRIPEDSPYVDMIRKEAIAQGVDPDLMLRMVAQESGFNPMAKSKAGAGGLFQLMPGTAKEMGVQNVYDPATNIKGGVGYYKKMLDLYGEPQAAMIAYNWGPGNFDKHRAGAESHKSLPQETSDYVQALYASGGGRPPPQGAEPSVGAPQPSLEGIKGVANPRAGAPEAGASGLPEPRPTGDDLPFTERMLNRALNTGEGLASGAGNVLFRTGRALGLPQAMGMDEQAIKEAQKAYHEKAQALPGGTAGGIAAEVVQAAPVMRGLQGVRALQTMPYTSNVLGAGAQSFITTPGNMGERATAAAKDAALSLPLTAGARTLAQPFRMRQDVADLRQAGVDAYPPLHIGAESRMMRDIGDVTKDLPVVGVPQRRGAERFGTEAVDILFERATPPGQPNLLRSGQVTMRPGDMMTHLNHQFDTAYNQALRGTRARLDANDFVQLQSHAANLAPAEQREFNRIFIKEIGVPTGAYQQAQAGQVVRANITGQDWRTIRDNLNKEIEKYSDLAASEKNPSAERLRDALTNARQQWEGHLNIPTQGRHFLQSIDESNRYRRLFEHSAAARGAEEGMNPTILRESMERLSQKPDIATGRGVGQDILDPLKRITPEHENTPLSNALRRMYPILATGTLGGASILGVPGSTAALGGLGTAAGLNMLSGYQPIARRLYGGGTSQQALAEAIRRYPGFMGALESSMTRKEQD